jgi:hypothetical protein
MIHLHTSVVCLLDRYFSDDVVLDPINTYVASFTLNERIEVRLYQDPPMYIALFYVDGAPVLKEHMIDDTVAGYIAATQSQAYLLDFVMDYAD